MSAEPLSLAESFEWAGLWWLPGADAERVPGVLRYSQDEGLNLTLIGSFEDRIMSVTERGTILTHSEVRTWPVLHGVAENREFTLLKCFPRSKSQWLSATAAGPDRQVVMANSAVVGMHLTSEGQEVFSTAEMSIEDLGYWANASPFSAFRGDVGSVLAGKKGLASEYIEPQVAVVDEGDIHLVQGLSSPFFDDRKGETIARIRNSAFLRVMPAQAFSLNEARKVAGIMQDLVSLATHRAAGLIWLRLSVAGDEDREPVFGRKADVLFFPQVVGRPSDERVRPHQAFFSCGDIPFEEVVPRWFQVHEQLDAASNMILGLRYAPAQFLQNQLLTAVGAAEVLHRNLGIEETPFPDDEFIEVREAMLQAAPEKYRDWLKSTVRNSQTLRGRLVALAGRLDENVMSPLIPVVDRWAGSTVRARNDLAHNGKTPRHSTDELIAVVDLTTAIVVLNLLQELGLSAEKQLGLVRHHQWLQRCVSMAKEWFGPPTEES